MTTQTNIEHFNRVVLVALDKLYDAFPVPIELSVVEVAMTASPNSFSSEPNFKELEPTFEAIKFMAKEDFVQYAEHLMDGTTFLRAQLTLKGLTVLGQVPASLHKNPSLISQIKATLKAGAKNATTDAAKYVVGQILTAASVAAPAAMAAITHNV